MNKIISTFCLSIFFSLSAHAGLRELVVQKTTNYNLLNTHYYSLLELIEQGSESEYCSSIKDSFEKLEKIFNQDYELIDELIKTGDDNFVAYADEIEANVYSPLFSYNASLSACVAGEFDRPLLKYALSNNITNVNYLALLHSQWRIGFGF